MTSDLRRMLAQALATAEREYRDAQQALVRDPGDAAKERYARAERNYRKVEALLKEASPPSSGRQLQTYALAARARRRS